MPTGGQEVAGCAAIGADRVGLALAHLVDVHAVEAGREVTDARRRDRDGGKAIAAARTLQWESPRGPVRIDPKTRHITQNVYLRKVEKAGSVLVNKEVQNFGPQLDYGLDK